MTRILPTRAARLLSRPVVALFVLGAILLGPRAAEAAFTTGKCLVMKRQAWGTLRKCEATEQVKQLKGKPADLPKCQTSFQAKVAKINAKATAAVIACRYGDNGDGTVTDYDTGLQWEQKTGEVGSPCFFFPDRISHCVNATYSWEDAQAFVSGPSNDPTTISSFFPGSPGWRLPTVAELHVIRDTTLPGCQGSSPCIDPIFGPTVAGYYWSATTETDLLAVWIVPFGADAGPVFFKTGKGGNRAVRAVRAGL